MLCENSLCIYQENNICLLDDISISEGGVCESCILVNFPAKTTAKIKAQQRFEKEQTDTPDARASRQGERRVAGKTKTEDEAILASSSFILSF